MAASIRSPAVILTVILVFLASFLRTAAYRGQVGGRTEIEDVKTNEEVQELGRFSVEEYNWSLRLKQEEEVEVEVEVEVEELEFVEVVEAQEQVVSGIKYYLKIAATKNGAPRMFDSEVVVKPWLRSKKLLNFAPSQ